MVVVYALVILNNIFLTSRELSQHITQNIILDMFMTLVFLICIIFQNAISFDCEDIFFGVQDFHLCPKNCIVCSLHNSCIHCLRHSSGSSCRAKCTIGCAEVYVTNGTLLRGCSTEKLADTCCMTCPHYSFCSDCLQFNGTCLKCSSGFYRSQTSSYCDKKCGHCQPDGNGLVECDINTGDCKDGCSGGYYGRGCDETCNKNCLVLKTNSIECDRQSGKCIYGCVPGRYSDSCESICSNTCLDSSCDQQSGTCILGCIHGFYGGMCEKNCSETCARLSCNQTTGHCTHGCVPGRYGYFCEDVCSSKCQNSICMQTTGHCNGECLPGWYGETCNIKCSNTCFGNVCKPLSGYCNNGCSAGWYGDTCEKACSSSCSDKTCNQTSGFCQNGCSPGSYGDMCETECNDTCHDKTCNQISGGCIYGCARGWFGDSCAEACSETCFNRSCDQFSGLCNGGCVSGYYGSNCEKNCSYDVLFELCDNSTASQCSRECTTMVMQGVWNKFSSTNRSSTLTVSTYILAGVVSAISFALATCFVRRVLLNRRHNLQKNLELPTIETTEPIYEEIDDIYGLELPTIETTEPIYEEIDDIYDSTTFENDPIHVDNKSMITTKSACGISHTSSYELNRAETLCPCRGSYEIPVSSATLMYENMDVARIDEKQHRNPQDISGISNDFEREFECKVTKSIHSSTTSETGETEKDDTYGGVNENQGDEDHPNKNPSTSANRESVLYLHPKI
ncbi:multiple epidermal growth factor-like domains protein 6 isoform X2 [Mercenaria mercenaria]|uniref:multiple epidermal growth factor-like domains protein 6 isoform X2 n=1 Tax=Mercenaria mercenaria TaxID=6596 RepID=UPI00234E6CF6|nr:multiple epidermal growth factor-like domains protein 6 isoform X2 [Mercenaria mercenaria]